MSGILNTRQGRDSPLHVLLVDDNEVDVKIAVRAVGQAKLKNRLSIVRNGQECVDFVRNEGAFADKEAHPRPDLILLDISMPVMDGFGVLKILKADADTRSIPVIIMTSSNNEDDIRQSYQLGANSFVRKPVIYEEFVEMLDAFNLYWHVVNTLPGRKDRG